MTRDGVGVLTLILGSVLLISIMVTYYISDARNIMTIQEMDDIVQAGVYSNIDYGIRIKEGEFNINKSKFEKETTERLEKLSSRLQETYSGVEYTYDMVEGSTGNIQYITVILNVSGGKYKSIIEIEQN